MQRYHYPYNMIIFDGQAEEISMSKGQAVELGALPSQLTINAKEKKQKDEALFQLMESKAIHYLRMANSHIAQFPEAHLLHQNAKRLIRAVDDFQRKKIDSRQLLGIFNSFDEAIVPKLLNGNRLQLPVLERMSRLLTDSDLSNLGTTNQWLAKQTASENRFLLRLHEPIRQGLALQHVRESMDGKDEKPTKLFEVQVHETIIFLRRQEITNYQTIYARFQKLSYITHVTYLTTTQICLLSGDANFVTPTLKQQDDIALDLNGSNACHYAAITGNVTLMKQVKAQGFDTNAIDMHANGVQHYAALSGRKAARKLASKEWQFSKRAENRFGQNAKYFKDLALKPARNHYNFTIALGTPEAPACFKIPGNINLDDTQLASLHLNNHLQFENLLTNQNLLGTFFVAYMGASLVEEKIDFTTITKLTSDKTHHAFSEVLRDSKAQHESKKTATVKQRNKDLEVAFNKKMKKYTSTFDLFLYVCRIILHLKLNNRFGNFTDLIQHFIVVKNELIQRHRNRKSYQIFVDDADSKNAQKEFFFNTLLIPPHTMKDFQACTELVTSPPFSNLQSRHNFLLLTKQAQRIRDLRHILMTLKDQKLLKQEYLDWIFENSQHMHRICTIICSIGIENATLDNFERILKYPDISFELTHIYRYLRAKTQLLTPEIKNLLEQNSRHIKSLFIVLFRILHHTPALPERIAIWALNNIRNSEHIDRVLIKLVVAKLLSIENMDVLIPHIKDFASIIIIVEGLADLDVLTQQNFDNFLSAENLQFVIKNNDRAKETFGHAKAILEILKKHHLDHLQNRNALLSKLGNLMWIKHILPFLENAGLPLTQDYFDSLITVPSKKLSDLLSILSKLEKHQLLNSTHCALLLEHLPRIQAIFIEIEKHEQLDQTTFMNIMQPYVVLLHNQKRSAVLFAWMRVNKDHVKTQAHENDISAIIDVAMSMGK